MTKRQIQQAKKMIKEGTYKIEEIYKVVYGTEYKDDCTCHNADGLCNCLAGTNCLRIILLQYDES